MSARKSTLRPDASPAGLAPELTVLRYGTPGARPKAYLQASLHADEIPGMLVLSHLREALESPAVRVRGEIVLVPAANPIGLGQWMSGRPLGRYAFNGGGNFNRLYPFLDEPAAARIDGRLDDDAAANVARIRAALADALHALQPRDEVEWLRYALLDLALDADIVLDLHCDEEALLHVYLGTPLWPAARDLGDRLHADAVLLAERSGGNPFDEAVAGPWWSLARRFPDRPVPAACLAATVELRGYSDVSDTLAREDAARLFEFLAGRGVIDGEPPTPEPACEATPLEGMDIVRAPHAGIVTWLETLGTRVAAGTPIAKLHDPRAGDDPRARTELTAGCDGLLFARTDLRFLRPGDVVCKVAGREPLAHRVGGPLLTD